MLAFLGLVINLPYVKDSWSQEFVCRGLLVNICTKIFFKYFEYCWR
jgi:hypothetical protein